MYRINYDVTRLRLQLLVNGCISVYFENDEKYLRFRRVGQIIVANLCDFRSNYNVIIIKTY